MTQEEIISMAEQSGLWQDLYLYGGLRNNLERFAKLVAEKEREECAKLADVWVRAYDHPSEAIARSIRARSKND